MHYSVSSVCNFLGEEPERSAEIDSKQIMGWEEKHGM